MTATVTTIREAIRSYCRAHPRAADTVEGIARWWLAELGPCQPTDVEDALEQLVSDGTLVRRTLVDGTVIYGGAASE